MNSKNIFLLIIICFYSHFISQNLILNSNSLITNKVIFLDFDGHLAIGTAWNSGNPVNALASTVSTAKKIEIWKRMCEDYSPFDVNITTDSLRFNNAPPNRRIRVVFTPTSAWFGSAGGVAYLNSFSWGGTPGTPCWVFENQLGYNAKSMGEAASHEAGHTFSLMHQSTYNNLCVKTAEYNPGIGTGITSWAPIMGVGYSKNITVWAVGKNSTSCTAIQYDHGSSGITGPAFLNYLTDDVGDNYNTAKILNLNSSSLLDSGIISTPADLDVYKFTICSNRYISFAVKPWALDTINFDGANLDIRFMLYSASTNSLIAIDTSLTRLKTLVGTNLTAGTYYFAIDGGRSANYNDYGSLGRYYISITSTNPPAIANTILSNSTICAGQSAVLNYSSTGVPTNWQWSILGPISYSSNLQNPIINFNQPGIYTISLVASTPLLSSCISSKTINIGSLPTPSIINTNNLICPYNNATLTASGASSYVWIPGNFSGTTQIVSPSVTTTYTLIGSNGSCNNTVFSTVSVSPDFTINIASTSSLLCPGQSLTLSASGANSFTFEPGTIISNSIIIFPSSTLIFTITGNVGLCSKYVSKIVNVSPDFTVGISASNTLTCSGGLISLMASGASSYTFNPGGISSNMIIVSPTISTIYSVLGKVNQCVNMSDPINIVVSECTLLNSSSDRLSANIVIYPNPASNFIYIESTKSDCSVEIISSLGQLVHKQNLLNNEKLNIQTELWSKGIYFIKVIGVDHSQKLFKIAVQ